MKLSEDLLSRQEARDLCREAREAQKVLGEMDQSRLDAIVAAMAKAFEQEAEPLAKMAVEETGFGNVQSKTEKNRFACENVLNRIRDLKTVGILKKEPGLWEVGVPVGVIAAIVPSTNPTSTVCYKAMIALKSGNAIVFSPHPKAVGCTGRAAEILARAAVEAGAPAGCIGCLSIASLSGCQELMQAPEVRLILATGGPAMVRAAYSSGKPAIGVGAGNGPAYIHHSGDLTRALKCILRSKTFDNGTVCASEQSIIVEKTMEQQLLETGRKLGYYFMDSQEAGRLGKILFRPNGILNPEIVGKSAAYLAAKAGFSVPENTHILVAREQEAGPTRPYSMEKLCPVLALFVMEDEDAVLNRAIEVLTIEGSGHTFVIHAEDPRVIERFALKIPVSRFLVNTPAALGGIGKTTKLFPALTLGCGAVGGSSSSNNISPMDLINIRRVAWDTQEQESGAETVEDRDLVEKITQQILKRLQ